MALGGSGGIAIARLAAAPSLTNPSLSPPFESTPPPPYAGSTHIWRWQAQGWWIMAGSSRKQSELLWQKEKPR